MRREENPERGISSVGRAPALQAGGHEFESRILHWITEGESAGGAGVFGYRMYLENRIQEKKKYQETCRVRGIREGQDIRGNEETLTKKFEENERKKLAQNQRRQRYAGVPGAKHPGVGHARKSIWWMPWH